MNQHPIIQTLTALAAVDKHFPSRLLPEPDDQDGWLLAADLAAENHAHLRDVLKRVARHYPSTSTQSATALWFGHYAFAVMAVPIACYLFARRVPEMCPRQVGVRFEGDGDIGGLAWNGRSFAALPDDPAANHPDCTVLPTTDTLRDHLREQMILHLTPIVAAARACSSFGKPGMWALAADYCANAFAWVGRLTGNEAWAIEEARLLAVPPSLLHRNRDFILIEWGDFNYYLVDRVSCCLYYKVEGGSYCSSCPHRPVKERISLIQGWLQEEAAKNKG